METPTLVLNDVSAATMAAMFGVDPGVQSDRPVAVTWSRTYCPVVEPRKSRGLTGKAYRSARRRYARALRAWRRSGSPMSVMHHYAPRAHIRAVNGNSAHDASLTIDLDVRPGRRSDTPQAWYDLTGRRVTP